MFARFIWVGVLILLTLSLGIGPLNQALCQEALVKGVPYVVQRAHLD